MLDVRRLAVLLEVSRHGSFSRAAQALGYTQPAVSRQIALLEAETGARLFDRRRGGARLTDAGRVLARHAEAIVARLHDAEAELGALIGMETGRLRMSTLTSAATTLVPPAIAEFRRRLPGVELSVFMVDGARTLAQLRAGELDLVLGNDDSHLTLDDVDAVHLFDEPMLIALPPDHPLAARARVHLSDLAGERWMLGTTDACPDATRFLRACHTAGFDPDVAFHHDDYTAILGFVEAGVGVAPVPEMVARGATAAVAIRPLHGSALSRPIVVSFPGEYRSGAAQAMLEILQRVSREWTAAIASAA